MYKDKIVAGLELERWIHRNEVALAVDESNLFPKEIRLGSVTEKEFWSGGSAIAREWSDFERSLAVGGGVTVKKTHRKWSGGQDIVSAVVVDSIDAAVGCGLVPRRAKTSVTWLKGIYRRCCAYLKPDEAERAMRAMRNWYEDDVENLFRCAEMLNADDLAGKTERQLAGSVPGVHAKWLDSKKHLDLLKLLLGASDADVKSRPKRVMVRYLDESLAEGNNGKRYDLFVEGDAPADYPPVERLLIVENDDVFDQFPDLPGYAVVQGSGKAGPSKLMVLPWVDHEEDVPMYYFGDIDADGLQILSDYRKAGFCVESVLMDEESLQAHGHIGTNQTAAMGSLGAGRRKVPDYLTDEEARAFELVTSREWDGNRRIEQEALIEEAWEVLKWR